MSEDKAEKLTGEQILASAVEHVNNTTSNKLKSSLLNTVKAIKDRERWIKNRQIQIELLKKVQVDLVRSYDAGTLDEDAIKKADQKIRNINSMTTEKTAVYEEEDEEEDY